MNEGMDISQYDPPCMENSRGFFPYLILEAEHAKPSQYCSDEEELLLHSNTLLGLDSYSYYRHAKFLCLLV